MKSLREVCRLVDVDRHVLQRIGTSKNNQKPLLPPTHKDESSGYWYYDDTAIEKIWLIKLFRELGCTYKQIQEILDSSDFDQREWFRKQIELLDKKKAYIDKLIQVAELIHTSGMLPTEIENVKEYSIAEYLEHINNSFNSIGIETADRIFGNDHFISTLNKMFDAWKAGKPPHDAKVQMLAKKAHHAFNAALKASGYEGFKMFGKMMLSNGDFSFKIDKGIGNGAANFLGETIKIYVERKENHE